ncbi:MAG: recombination regulator RecX [Candidatus Gracilibacteria bacterium]|nr:recombination regulator RecX [Candidatus Gracilibacteria bacterium]
MKNNNSDFLNQTNRGSVHETALRFLSRREYSVAGLREKLVTKFPEDLEEVEAVLKALQQKGWLSDERFTELLIREKAEISHWGPRKILMKLREKGIDPALAEEQLAKLYSEEDQQKAALILAEEKRKKLRAQKTPAGKEREKLFSFLAQRGFEIGSLNAVLDEVLKS